MRRAFGDKRRNYSVPLQSGGRKPTGCFPLYDESKTVCFDITKNTVCNCKNGGFSLHNDKKDRSL